MGCALAPLKFPLGDTGEQRVGWILLFGRAPGIAESVDWAKALVAMDTLIVDPEVLTQTAGVLFKQREDVAALTPEVLDQLFSEPESKS